MEIPLTKSVVDRFWSKTIVSDGCWLWSGAQARGRARLCIRRGFMAAASRVSWTIANGPVPDGMHVLHSCDNGMCVRPDHLHLGDHATNMAEMSYRRRVNTTKLTPEQVVEIRARLSAGESGAALAREYGVVKSTIYWIRDGKTWRSVGEEGQMVA